MILVDLYFINHCYEAYESKTLTIPLERAAHKDRMEKERLLSEKNDFEWNKFSTTIYEQPALRSEPIGPEPYDGGDSRSYWTQELSKDNKNEPNDEFLSVS